MAKADWEELKREYLQGDYKNLKIFAEVKKLNYGYLRKKATGWEKEQGTKKEQLIIKEQKRNTPDGNKIEETIKIENGKLNDKQRLFCSYYIKYRNKTTAYMKAYQCSYDNAHAHAYELWQNVAIKTLIDQELKEFRDNVGLEAQDIVQKYIDIAFSDIKDFLDFGVEEIELSKTKAKGVKKIKVNYIDFKNSSDVDGTIISEVKQSKDGVSIKLNDKMKALEWLGKHVDILETETKLRLELEENKFKYEKSKINGSEDEESEDDGFIEALKSTVNDVWDDIEF